MPLVKHFSIFQSTKSKSTLLWLIGATFSQRNDLNTIKTLHAKLIKHGYAAYYPSNNHLYCIYLFLAKNSTIEWKSCVVQHINMAMQSNLLYAEHRLNSNMKPDIYYAGWSRNGRPAEIIDAIKAPSTRHCGQCFRQHSIQPLFFVTTREQSTTSWECFSVGVREDGRKYDQL